MTKYELSLFFVSEAQQKKSELMFLLLLRFCLFMLVVCVTTAAVVAIIVVLVLLMKAGDRIQHVHNNWCNPLSIFRLKSCCQTSNFQQEND